MDRQTDEDVTHRAATLLREAEQLARAGAWDQAASTGTLAWTLAHANHDDLANVAAWEVVWLQLQMGCYEEAVRWLDRVSPPSVAYTTASWSTKQQVLQRIEEIGVAHAASSGIPRTPGALAPLHIRNLGQFVVVRDGRPLPACKARKAVGILRYLLARRHRSASKEALMEALWPDASPADATHSVHVAVNALRRYLDHGGPSYIVHEAGSYVFNPAAVITDDYTEWGRLSAEAEHWRTRGDGERAGRALLAAMTLYGGDYYTTEHDPASMLAERERGRARHLANLEHLGQLYMAQGAFALALPWFERLLEYDPYREDVLLHLMRCLATLGRRGEALRQYERFALVLRNDLGLDPMDEVEALRRAIIDQQVSQPYLTAIDA